jgi:hypothetical protein
MMQVFIGCSQAETGGIQLATKGWPGPMPVSDLFALPVSKAQNGPFSLWI